MLKEYLLIIALTAVVSSHGALAEDENPYFAASAGLQARRSRRKLPTSKKLIWCYTLE